MPGPRIREEGREVPATAGATAFTVFLFGELRVQLNGRLVAPLESTRARSLLAYLLLHADAPQSRQRLAFLLWPDSSEAQARTNLRHLLHTLRRAMPEVEPFLEVTPQTLRWRTELSYWLDVDAFEAALARAALPGADVDVALTSLREALGYYTEDLLTGCYDEWLVERRDHLRDRYLSALERISDLLAGRGDHAEAIRFGRELLRSDPLREDAYRRLIGLLDDAGDGAGAVRVYHECASTLSRELGVEPSTKTVRAYEAVIQRHPSEIHHDKGTASDLEPNRAGGAVLVAREPEWRALTDCWRDAEAGHAQLVVVTGEPGIGKTRLVEELQAWCARRGAVVAEARSYPGKGELGFGVVSSWLRSVNLLGQLQRLGRADSAELCRLIPELGVASIDKDASLSGPERRRRLFDAIRRALAPLSRSLLLVADDAQWCDDASLQLIHYLVRSGLDTPLLVVATARREEMNDQHPLVRLTTELQIRDRSTEIPLDRLTRAGTAELVRHLVGSPIDESSLDALYLETEGNPLFVVETARAGWHGSSQQRRELTPKLRAVISARFQQLSEPARDLIGIAATVGRAFTAPLLRQASRLDDLELVRTLDELWRRGVIREYETDAYDFSHGKLRDVAYEALSPATRRRNHLLVAEALQRVHEREIDAISGQVAANYESAGLAEDAIGWYRRAAVQAQRLDANAEAVRLLDRANSLASLLPVEARLRHELDILTALPTPLALVDGFASNRLREVQRRAVEAAASVGVEPEPELLRSVVMSSLCHDDFDGAHAVAVRLRDAAVVGGDDGLLIESTYLLGICAFWNGDLGNARAHFEDVVGRFRPAQRAPHLVRFGHDPQVVCLSRLANTLWFLGQPDDARRLREAALDLAKEVGHPFSRSTAYIFASLMALDLDEADRVIEYAAALGEERDPPLPNEIKAMALTGLAEVLTGNVDQGIDRIRSAIEICGPVNHAPGFRAALMRLVVAAYAAAGDADAGLAAAGAALGPRRHAAVGGGATTVAGDVPRCAPPSPW